MPEQSFPLGSILTVTAGRVLAREYLTGAYDLLRLVLGAETFSMPLHHAFDRCAATILQQHPSLEGIIIPQRFKDEEQVSLWLGQQEAVYGTMLPIVPPTISREVEAWLQAVNSYKIGDEADGRICKIIGFGAFVEIGPNLTGFAHVSQLGQLDFTKPSPLDHLMGQSGTFRIVNIDRYFKRISLQLVRLHPEK
jgi:hypothetical protein